MSTIGIKVANGEFYAILEANSAAKKRLVLTTAHDNQQSIQIDLYQSRSRSMRGAQYLGSLIVEKLRPLSRGTPSVELILHASSAGELTATAMDLGAPGKREPAHLQVSLAAFDRGPGGTAAPEDAALFYAPSPSLLFEEEPRRRPLLLAALAGSGALLLGAALWLILTQRLPWSPSEAQGQSAPEQGSPASPPPAPLAADPRVEEPPPPAPPPPGRARQQPQAPVKSYPVPAAIPKQGVPYKVRWGDTLWDISEAFYHNPWLYHRIARFNGLRNPSRITAGTIIRVPPRN